MMTLKHLEQAQAPVLPTLSLRWVAAFVAVAEHGSFRKAAESLYLDASAVSKLVRHLENEIGGPLLRRSTREVTTTEHGQAVLVVARRLLADVRALTDAAAGAEDPDRLINCG